MTLIRDVRAIRLELDLNRPFETALGKQTAAKNVLVTVETESGVTGYGEAAPNPAVTGETQGAVVETVDAVAELLLEEPPAEYRRLITAIRDSVPGAWTAVAAIETALLDCYCRVREIPLAELFGGQPRSIRTDLTIPLISPDVAREQARDASDRGFESLKVKAGGEIQADLERLRAVRAVAPTLPIVVDANQGWTRSDTRQFVTQTSSEELGVDLLEQPIPKTDIRGLATIRSQTSIPVAGDEVICTAADALEVVRQDAVDVINIKLAKSGFLEALDIAAIATAADVDLMIGCMLESSVGANASAHLAAGLGAFTHVDLDSTALLADDVVESDSGPIHRIEGPGHGIVPETL